MVLGTACTMSSEKKATFCYIQKITSEKMSDDTGNASADSMYLKIIRLIVKYSLLHAGNLMRTSVKVLARSCLR